jgi:hypothetical protein
MLARMDTRLPLTAVIPKPRTWGAIALLLSVRIMMRRRARRLRKDRYTS